MGLNRVFKCGQNVDVEGGWGGSDERAFSGSGTVTRKQISPTQASAAAVLSSHRAATTTKARACSWQSGRPDADQPSQGDTSEGRERGKVCACQTDDLAMRD